MYYTNATKQKGLNTTMTKTEHKILKSIVDTGLAHIFTGGLGAVERGGTRDWKAAAHLIDLGLVQIKQDFVYIVTLEFPSKGEVYVDAAR